jgi:hypothetical protein
MKLILSLIILLFNNFSVNFIPINVDKKTLSIIISNFCAHCFKNDIDFIEDKFPNFFLAMQQKSNEISCKKLQNRILNIEEFVFFLLSDECNVLLKKDFNNLNEDDKKEYISRITSLNKYKID